MLSSILHAAWWLGGKGTCPKNKLIILLLSTVTLTHFHSIALSLSCNCRKNGDAAIPPMGLAVGPWHVMSHVADCQEKFGSRFMKDLGLSYGDNPEHTWAEIRRFSPTIKYASPTGRKDFIQDLVSGQKS